MLNAAFGTGKICIESFGTITVVQPPESLSKILGK